MRRFIPNFITGHVIKANNDYNWPPKSLKIAKFLNELRKAKLFQFLFNMMMRTFLNVFSQGICTFTFRWTLMWFCKVSIIFFCNLVFLHLANDTRNEIQLNVRRHDLVNLFCWHEKFSGYYFHCIFHRKYILLLFVHEKRCSKLLFYLMESIYLQCGSLLSHSFWKNQKKSISGADCPR